MKQFRWLLLPFSLLYGAAVRVRNGLYSAAVYKSYTIPVKSIVVGNLSVGGTGKSPLVVWLVDYFAENKVTATLSRGYGRKSKGLRFATETCTSSDIGDEPLQYKKRFKDRIEVAVAEQREVGVRAILAKNPKTELIVLDDAFQHRAVTAGLNILVTEYNHPFCNDFLLPVGNLREPRSGASRADIILVSKCPEIPNEKKRAVLKEQLSVYGKPVFFSKIKYEDLIPFGKQTEIAIENVLLVTGIGNPEPLVNYLKLSYNVSHLKFPDHYDFTAKDILSIHQKFNTFASRNKVIVTTEKDYMRLSALETNITGDFPWFYQPISVVIDDEAEFKNLLNEYVRKN